MKTDPREFRSILDNLKSANVRRYSAWEAEIGGALEYIKLLRQDVSPAEPTIPDVSSLEKGVYHPLSPLLKIRFDYAGRWTNAVYSNSLFSQREVTALVDDARVIEQVKIRQENWENSPPAAYPWSQISLFGANLSDYEEIYLVWKSGNEPSVVSYISNCEYAFDDIGDFLLFYTFTER